MNVDLTGYLPYIPNLEPGTIPYVWEERRQKSNQKIVLREHERLNGEQSAKMFPLSIDVRKVLVKAALSLCNLEIDADGQTRPIPGSPQKNRRVSLSAMRVVASFDRLARDQEKLELERAKLDPKPNLVGFNPDYDYDKLGPLVSSKTAQICSDVLYSPERVIFIPPTVDPQAVAPQVDLKKKRDLVQAEKMLIQNWPITDQMRGQIMVQAMSLCGFAVTGDGSVIEVEPLQGEEPPKPRIKLAAMRVVSAYGRLMVEHERFDLRTGRDKELNAVDPWEKLPEDMKAALERLIREDQEETRRKYAPVKK